MKIRELFSGRILTVSNLLSLTRVIFLPFIAYTFQIESDTDNEHYKIYSLAILSLMMMTDFFDGFLARKLNQVSRLGQFIDPLADKLSALGLGLLLFYYKGFPLWMIIIMVFRDIYVIVGGIILFSKRDIQARPNIYGKLMIGSMGISAFIFIISPTVTILGITLQTFSIFLILFFLIISSLQYWSTYSRIYFEKKL